MKKIIYSLVLVIIVLISSFYFYNNFIYYNISYNPIKEYSSETDVVDFYITRNSPEGEEINTKCQDTNNCKKVLEYFIDLNLKPIKDKTASEMLNHESKIYYTGMLKFGESPAADTILLSDISVDTPNVLRISSSIPGFKSGYYEMEDSNFDYNYILDLIGKPE